MIECGCCHPRQVHALHLHHPNPLATLTDVLPLSLHCSLNVGNRGALTGLIGLMEDGLF